MKKLLLVLTGVLLLQVAQGQTLSALKDTVTGTSPLSYGEFTITTSFMNNSGAARICTWSRDEISIPAGWLTSVCDVDQCYGTGNNSESIIYPVPNNQTTPILVNFFPSNGVDTATAGTGIVKINFFYPGDTTSAIFIATISATSGINNVATVKDIFLYPTPAQDNLNIVFASNIRPNRIELYNVLGQKIKTIPVQLERNSSKTGIDVSDIDKGIYFLRVYSGNSSVVITKQFTKG